MNTQRIIKIAKQLNEIIDDLPQGSRNNDMLTSLIIGEAIRDAGSDISLSIDNLAKAIELSSK